MSILEYKVSENDKKLLRELKHKKAEYRTRIIENFTSRNSYNPSLMEFLDFLALQPKRFSADDLESIALQASEMNKKLTDIHELHTYDVWENELLQSFKGGSIGTSETSIIKPYFLNVVADEKRDYCYSPSHFRTTSTFSADLFFTNESIANYEKKKPTKILSANVCGYAFSEYLNKNNYTYKIEDKQNGNTFTFLNKDTSVICYFSEYKLEVNDQNRLLEFLLPSFIRSYCERILKKEFTNKEKNYKVFDDKSRKSVLLSQKYKDSEVSETEYNYLASVIAYMTMTKLGINKLSQELHRYFAEEKTSYDKLANYTLCEKLISYWKKIYDFSIDERTAKLLRMQYEEKPDDDCIFLQRLDLCREKSDELAKLIISHLGLEGKHYGET